MPITRKQKSEENQGRIFEEPPASPSSRTTATSRAPNDPTPRAPALPESVSAPAHVAPPAPAISVPITMEPATSLTAVAAHAAAAPAPAASRHASRRSPAASVRSQRSNSSAIARIRQAEYDAQERLAVIQRKELQLEAELVRKRLAMDVATIREETDRDSDAGPDDAETEHRVSDWLQKARPRGAGEHEMPPLMYEDTPAVPASIHVATRGERVERNPDSQRTRMFPQHDIPRIANDTPRRPQSPTPARSKERGIDRLAEALERMSRRRPPPRQAQELPTFSGAPSEWLIFKTSMRDSTRMYEFTQAENLARLRNSLKGDARETVASLLHTAADPAIIMNTLEQCYGRPEIIIDKALDDLRRLPRPGTTAAELNTFAIRLQNIVSVLTCIDNRGYLQNPMLARQVIEKLSPHVRARWCDYAQLYGSPAEPDIVTLSRYLMQEADRAVKYAYLATNAGPATTKESAKTPVHPRTTGPPRHGGNKRRGPVAYAATEGRRECLCCGEEHDTPTCKKLTDMNVKQRWDWAKEARVCFRCLASRHRRMRCTARKCGIEECRQPHHKLLHAADRSSTTVDASEKKDEDTVTTASAHAASVSNAVLLKICPVTIRGPTGRTVATHALLDEGSTITLLDDELAREIDAQGPKRALLVHGITASQQETESRIVDLEVKGRRSAFHKIKARTVKHLDITSQTVRTSHLQHEHLKQLRKEDLVFEDAKPRLLIGADNWHLIVSRKLLIGKRTEPAASLTQLGWVVHGTVPRAVIEKRADDQTTVLHTHAQNSRDNEISDMIKAHYDIDSLGIKSERRPIPEDERAKDSFNKTARLVGDHYEVGLPWRNDNPRLPPSYDMASRRLRSIERKMDKSTEFKDAYTAQVDNLLSKGYAVETHKSDDKNDDPKEWYLPHFAVTNPNKPGKLRLVFDAAASANGKCLNDELLAGPDLLRTLHGILFRFREKPVAVTADIREMFLRIKIRPEDQPAQQFLWRGEDRTNPPRRYTMQSMIFGARSSPFLAHSVRNRNAEDCRHTHPRAFHAVTTNHYMDDWVDSFDDTETAAATIKEVVQVHKRAGFELAGWNANCSHLLDGIEKQNRADAPKELGATAHPYGKTLGLIWMPTQDEFAFNTNMPRVPSDVRDGKRAPTKREMLAAVMSIFDPLGLLSPYTIAAKITLQELWRKDIGWDEQVPTEEAVPFLEWIEGLRGIAELRIPRCYVKHPIAHRSLHIFTDASEQAYAAAAYWRLTTEQGQVMITLVAGKAKVAPIKAQSIPRLELQACLIGARLAAEVIKEHRWHTTVTLWSDSKTALHWIHNDSAKYTPYVAHRLCEITELTKPEQWRWVPTTHNVADDATRAGINQMGSNDRWYTGPAFLYEPEEAWPRDTPTLENHEESVNHATTRKPLIDMSRFSSYERLVKTAACVLFFIDKCRKHAATMELRHRQEAEALLIKESQRGSFSKEIERLSAGRRVEKTSRLYKLDPLYEDGMIRLNGRINAADVLETRKRPPIIDGRHALARLYIRHVHERNHHAGREHVVNSVRTTHWILRLRPSVRATIKDCTTCKLRRANPPTPVKGNLPQERLDPYSRPFTRCGVDCFGPMNVTVGRRHEKRWGMLFTCLVTRAIHIELIPSLNIDSAIMALRRMAARRGWPSTIMSDNGTNFHGANVELENAYKTWAKELPNYGLNKGFEWKFIDPGAPNQGGAWERMIRTVKAALATVLKERAPKDEVLNTLLTEVEHTVNSRPLTHVSVEHTEQEALTPNHFLLGSTTGLPRTGTCDPADRKAWRAAQALADQFWNRWINEYLPTLTPRGDIRNPGVDQITEGDVVIIADGQLPRNVWPRGRVERAIAGPDGVVRSAEVRTRGGTFRRPVRRLIVLTKV